MAGISQKDIKSRIRRMESTRKITGAMEMVAASKLRKAQKRVLSSKPYFETLYATVQTIVDESRDFSSPYLKQGEGKGPLYVVIAGDRGLAGGYNSNVLKSAALRLSGGDGAVLPIGKKAVEFFRARKIPMLTQEYACAEKMSGDDCFALAEDLARRFLAKEFDGVYVVYTDFVSVLAQVPATLCLLPLRRREEVGNGMVRDILFDPDCAEVLAGIAPVYLGGVLYGVLCESRASEQAARRLAMDAASKNADEMIGDLQLKYNRARQAAITQQITEIVSGN